MRPLSPTLAKMAREELNETPDRIQQDLIILRVWINQQAHLRARTSDEFLLAFLRRSRFSLEETKQRLEKFYKCFNKAPEIFKHRRVTQRLLDINRLGIHFYPEYPKCTDNMALLIARFGAYDTKRIRFREVLQFVTMAMEIIAIENDNASVAGVCEIVDLKNVTMEKMRNMDQSLFKKFWDWVQDCCPLEVKQIYFLNAPKEMLRVVNFRPSITPKSINPPIFVKNLEQLYTFVPKACLPEEYGGSNGHIKECVSYMEDLLISYRSYFAEEAHLGLSEEHRLSDVKPFEAQFGLDGTFRKLHID